MSDCWEEYDGRTVPLKELLKWLSDEHTHITDDEGDLLEGWDFPVVNSMALHRWAIGQAEPVEYEYAVERTSLMRPDQTFFVGNYWGDLEDRQDALDGLEALNGTSVKYWMVKRRKAGKVERV